MLLGFLVLDQHKFSLFEYFPDRTQSQDIMLAIDNIDGFEGHFSFDGLEVEIRYFSSKFAFCVIYREEELTGDIIENLKTLGNNVMNGDKVSLRQILNSTELSAFKFVH